MTLQVGTRWRKPEDRDAAILQDAAEGRTVQWIAVHDQGALPPQEPVEAIGEVPGDLLQPLSARVARDPRDVDAPGRKLHDEEHVVPDEPAPGEDLDGEEIGSSKHRPM